MTNDHVYKWFFYYWVALKLNFLNHKILYKAESNWSDDFARPFRHCYEYLGSHNFFFLQYFERLNDIDSFLCFCHCYC